MQDFAQELVDLVIDNVAATGKSRDIGSCGTVCRRWLPRSRMHLFSHIVLSNSSRATVEMLMNLVDASSSNILCFVRTLDIRLECRISERHMARLHSCARLRELRIRVMLQVAELEFEHFVLNYAPRFGASCPSLTRFELYTSADIPLNILADLISSLPRLTHLRLSGVFSGGRIVDPATTPSHNGVVYPKTVPPADTLCPNWHSLDISLSQGATLLFQWLLSHSEPPSFTSLKLVGWVSNYSIEPICSYLRRFGSRMESLSLEYGADRLHSRTDCETRAFQMHALASTPKLAELSLTVYDSNYIPAILLSISSVRLTTLKIRVLDDEPLDWMVLDTVLALPKFSSLQNISFTHWGHSLITQQVKELMPQTSARNIFAQM